MTFPFKLTLAAATFLGTSALALSPVLATQAFDPGTGSMSAPTMAAGAPANLRRFAIEAGNLTFQGENRRVDLPFFVTADESAARAKLVLSFDSAISVLPENSRMLVFVNDTLVSETALGRAGRQSITADLPSALLQPGFNGVRVLVEQHHRVDCSVSSTYELWTKIDPETSGFVFDGASRRPNGLAELAATQPSEDGRVRLRGIVSSGAAGGIVDQTMSAIQSAVLLGYFDAPVVEFSDKAGTGPGLDVVVGTVDEVARLVGDAKGNTDLPFVSLLTSPDGARQTLVVSGVTSDNVRQNLAALVGKARAAAPSGPAAGQRSLAMFQGHAVGSGETVSLRDLGADTRPFAGRFYRDAFRLILPADFYAADYDNASITLDASFAAGLSADAQLLIRANDQVVTTLPLSSSKSGQIRGQRMRVPLQTLKPGVNVFTMEAIVPTASDAVCDASAQTNAPIRFSLADTSSVTMPHFARVGHAPDIAAMTAGIAEANRAEEKGLTVLVPNFDRPLLGAAGTFIAKIASSTRKLQPVRTTALMPLELKDDLLAFGSMSALPSQLFDTIRVAQAGQLVQTAENAGQLSLLATPAAAATASAPAPSSDDLANALAGTGPAAPSAAEASDAAASVGTSMKRTIDDLKGSAGWAASAIAGFATAQGKPEIFVPSSDAALTIAQMPAPEAFSSSTWTMVTASDKDRVVSGVTLATQRDKWSALDGAVTEISADGTEVVSHAASSERLFETQPRSFSNARLVLAGWFSRHTEQYLVALIGTLLLLGFATSLFLRNVGEKNQ